MSATDYPGEYAKLPPLGKTRCAVADGLYAILSAKYPKFHFIREDNYAIDIKRKDVVDENGYCSLLGDIYVRNHGVEVFVYRENYENIDTDRRVFLVSFADPEMLDIIDNALHVFNDSGCFE